MKNISLLIKKLLFITNQYGLKESLLAVIRFFMWPIRDFVRSIIWYFFINNKKEKIINLRINKDRMIKLFLNPKDRGISVELMLEKIHEPYATKFYINKLSTMKNLVILDIGANIGYYILILKDLIIKNNFKIYAFEPDPINYNILIKNLKINNLENYVTTYQKAIYNKTGKIKFFISKKRNWNSILTPKSKKDCFTIVKSISIIDFVKENNTRIDIIRMDIEGAEFYLFDNSFKEIIKLYSPDFFIEIHPKLVKDKKIKNSFFKILDEFNYYITFYSKKICEEKFFGCYLTTLKPNYKKISITDFIKSEEYNKFEELFILYLSTK